MTGLIGLLLGTTFIRINSLNWWQKNLAMSCRTISGTIVTKHMMTALPLLPVAALLCFSWYFKASQGKDYDFRLAFSRSSILWGFYLALSTEILSLGNLLTKEILIIVWGIPVTVTILLASLRQCRFNLLQPITHLKHLNRGDRFLIILFLLACLLTAIVAWLSPPQTWDSLNYHMARVAHWAQNGSIKHFATGIEFQNAHPPGGEVAILHVYILGNSDRLVTFVQWWAMISSSIVVSWIAKYMGANPRTQILAALICATIPLGIIQASSTVNDYIVSYWVLLAGAETLIYVRSPDKLEALFFAGVAAGLALWTKPIAVPFLAPFGFVFSIRWVISMIKHTHPTRRILKWTTLALICLLAINSGHWLRNIQTYGNPVTNKAILDTHLNQLMTPAGIASNLIRNMAFHTGLPWGRANLLIYNIIVEVHRWLKVDIEDPRTTSIPPFPWMAIRTNEENAGNTLHAGLIVVSVFAILYLHSLRTPTLLIYTLAASMSLVIFSAVFKWQIFGSRYHLPFFVIFSPIISMAMQHVLSQKILPSFGFLLFLCSFPWFFSIDSRPLIPTDRSLIGSILTTPREDIYFANAYYQEKPYHDIASYIKEKNCDRIGLSLGGIQTEYLIWHVLGAPQKNLRLEWFVAGTDSEKYRDYSFKPCAVICENCTGSGSEQYEGLPLIYDSGEFKLYLDVSPQW